MKPLLPISALALAAVVACKQPAEAPPVAETKTPAKQAAKPAQLAPDGWTRLDEAALSEPRKAQLAMAREAQQALASTLMGELKAAVGEGDWAKGVEACKTAAPKVKAKVSGEYDLEIGRTSFKVRNPDNRPSGWRVPLVEARTTTPVVLEGPAGQLGYMAPIMMAQPCTNCHGAAAQIPDDVEKMLALAYPEDQATGFAEGDLRGWFWVEVAER